MLATLLDQAEIRRLQISRQVDRSQRAGLGQFFTPAVSARRMAGMFQPPAGAVRLLDPGAGVGVLTAAFVEKIMQNPQRVNAFSLTAYEIEALFLPGLEQTLVECCQTLESAGIPARYELRREDFLQASTLSLASPLFGASQKFTHAILNPPYKKIHSQSAERKALSRLGLDTVNLYSAFVWLALLLLEERGEMAAITPRSFCNGSYYRPFRRALLSEMALDQVHVFESRSTTFADDEVLQENLIFHAVKHTDRPEFVRVVVGNGFEAGEVSSVMELPYSAVVKPGDREMYIHLASDAIAQAFSKQMEAFPARLFDLGLEVSTGPVVDFRLKEFLRNELQVDCVPLLYPEATRSGTVTWPPAAPRKPIAIQRCPGAERGLNLSGWYVLTRRFTAKEERRRVVAVVCPPVDFPVFGIENHLNFFHANGRGMPPDLARGLAAFLNSTLFDNYFRQFSGHTQVNATDLRKLRYPDKEDLAALGQRVGNVMPAQDELDQLIQEVLPLMNETTRALQASQRIEEALAILKDISAPREQQNERSALCLLALGEIRPDVSWSEAQRPLRGITEIMGWFREHYGKEYAPNTRETVRRQTMHQFIQMGLVIENPDKPDRPINSPYWCYQLSTEAFDLLRAYGSPGWETARQAYTLAVSNLLAVKHRDLPMLPVELPDGQEIELSAGGQNELIRAILEDFCPRFTPGGVLLYIGDAGEKFIINQSEALAALGVKIDPHGKMPDLVVYHQEKDWLVIIEAVTSHGPVNLKRHNELKQIFGSSQKGLVFVTAFPSRREMTRYLAEISWETEVWVADQPEHLIHFNGERFLGPYVG